MTDQPDSGPSVPAADFGPQQAAALFASAEYLTSATGRGDLPPADREEIAFAGRSNAGKSSALNTVTGRRALARVSKTPGRTQLLNFFDCSGLRLVDLPGYGFAKVPERIRRDWGQMVGGFLQERPSLAGLVVVMDIRHPLKPQDRQMLDWAAARALPVLALLTKADKLAWGKARAQQQAVIRDTRTAGAVTVQLFSSQTRLGLDEARMTMAGWLAEPL